MEKISLFFMSSALKEITKKVFYCEGIFGLLFLLHFLPVNG